MVWEEFTTATVFLVLSVCVFSLSSDGMTPKPKFPSTMWALLSLQTDAQLSSECSWKRLSVSISYQTDNGYSCPHLEGF